MKFIITKNISDEFPSLRLGLAVINGIDNKGVNEDIVSLLAAVHDDIRKSSSDIENNETIKKWRDVFRSFGAKPKKHKSSVEALITRILSGEKIGHINNLVDICNYISLKYMMPVGGDDTDKVEGDIILRYADGTEKADMLGTEGAVHPKKGEIVYRDNEEVLCRRWNWRESVKTQMDENTKNAVIVIESLLNEEKLEDALSELSSLTEKYLGAKTEKFILDKDKPSLDISEGKLTDETFRTTDENKDLDKSNNEKNAAIKKGKNVKKFKPQGFIEKSVFRILGNHVKPEHISLETPPDEKMGDVAFPCFALSKEYGKAPARISKELSEKTEPAGIIKKIEPAGPYINFFVDWESYGKSILEEIRERGDGYGKGNRGLTYMMDVFQANPFKSFHIGHVKNAVFGEAIRRILEFNGNKTITVNYNGDVGTHVAKWLWYYRNFYEGDIPEDNFIHWTGDIYAKACEKADEKPEYKDRISEMNRLIDKRDPEIMPLWKKIRDMCYDAYMKIADELGCDVQNIYPESECEEPGKRVSKELLEKGILKESDGAVIADLEDDNLGVLVFLKNDGTALYAAKDLGLLSLKKKHDFDKLIYIIASEQDLYLKQLFTVFDKGGLSRKEDNIHVSYGLVTLKEGKMASRLGNVIVYEDLKREMVKKANEEIEKSNPGLQNKDDVAKMIAFGAIKFSMLNIDNVKPIKFDRDEALDLHGKTGPYIQYTHARMCSLIEKAGISSELDISLLKDEREISLIRHLAKFPKAVSDSYDELKPLIIVNYVYDLASKFNEFYQFVPVIKSEDKIKKSRAALTEAAMQVMKNGMWILGIDAPEKM